MMSLLLDECTVSMICNDALGRERLQSGAGAGAKGSRH